jgi:hypothetical protein
MTHIEIVKALQSLRAGAEWTLSGDDYANLVWLSAGKAPTLAEIEAEIAAIPGREAAALAAKEAEKSALLAKLGITEDEAKLLLS